MFILKDINLQISKSYGAMAGITVFAMDKGI
jgi:hypothetical protein